MKKQIRWKVVSEDLKSIIYHPWCIQYKCGEWVSALRKHLKYEHGLTVFDSLQSAKKFIKKEKVIGGNIYECEVKNEIKELPLFFEKIVTMMGLIIDTVAWLPSQDKTWPNGTEMYEKVKLIKRIS